MHDICGWQMFYKLPKGKNRNATTRTEGPERKEIGSLWKLAKRYFGPHAGETQFICAVTGVTVTGSSK